MTDTKVKPLEWIDVGEGPRCITVCGMYAIHPSSGSRGTPKLSLTGMPGNAFGKFDSVDQAKAAAQADYEQRILSAIEPTPVAPVPVTITPEDGWKGMASRSSVAAAVAIEDRRLLLEDGRKLLDMLPEHWHDEATTNFRDLVSSIEKRLSALSAKPTGEE